MQSACSRSRRLLPLLILTSGWAALVYETVWFRWLGLIFGNTVHAAAAVMSATMLGMGLGALGVGRFGKRFASPLRGYASVNLAIAVSAILVPIALRALPPLYRLLATVIPSGVGLGLLRTLLGITILLVPAGLIGATLPLVTEASSGDGSRFGRTLGLVYGFNTLGACLGVLSCGFFCIEVWGLRTTNALAVLANALVGIAGLVIPIAGQVHARGEYEQRARASVRAPVLLFVVAASGFLGLAYETIWFRALILVMGSTVYSFALMLGIFLLGLALGAAVGGRSADTCEPGTIMTAALVGAGSWTLITMPIFSAAPDLFLRVLARTAGTWSGMLAARGLLAVLFLLPLALCFGACFAAAAKYRYRAAQGALRAVASVSTANTLGAAAGAAVAAFGLLPALGLAGSLRGLASLALALALLSAFALGLGRRGRLVLAMCALAGLVWSVAWPPQWDRILLSSGAYFGPWNYIQDGRVTLRQRLSSEQLLFYKEGVSSTVSLTRTADQRLYFCSDGKTEADTTPRSMALQRLIGHLPMLCHPGARRVLNIGLGAGVTLGALADYPVEVLEAVEIEPAVTNVARFWSDWNGRVLDRSNVRLLANDGRNHLLLTTNRYDVITSDPFEPVVAGASSLYTVEHYRQARARLNAGGIMAQFLPLYEMSQDDYRMLLRSFMQAFPHTAVFFTGYDTILLGFTEGAGISLPVIAHNAAIPAVRTSLQAIGIARPEQVLEMLVAESGSGISLVPEGPLNTDDRPRIEFSAPRSALRYQPDLNQRALADTFGQLDLDRYGLDPAARARVQRGRDSLLLLLEANAVRADGDLQRNVGMLTAAFEAAPGNPIIRTELAVALASVAEVMTQRHNDAAAIETYQRVLGIQPDDFWALYHLVYLAMREGRADVAARYLQRGLELYPDAPLWVGLRGKFASAQGDPAAAVRDLRAAVAALPRHAPLWEDLAAALDRGGDEAGAHAAKARAQRLNN